MTQRIPLEPLEAQTVTFSVRGQPVRLFLYDRGGGLYIDVYVNDVLIISGTRCRDSVYIIRDVYHGFNGDLFFFDLLGAEDPHYAGLGKRWVLCYGTR